MDPDFDGDTYKRSRDKDRLTHQLLAVKRLMADANWRSLSLISHITGHPESSVSARLRDLRKEKFGGYLVERRHVADGLWEYRVMQRVPIQLELVEITGENNENLV